MESSPKLPPTRNDRFSHLDPQIEIHRARKLRGITKEKKKKYSQSQLFLPKANNNKRPYLYPLSQHITQANPLLIHSIFRAMEISIANDHTGFEIPCTQR